MSRRGSRRIAWFVVSLLLSLFVWACGSVGGGNDGAGGGAAGGEAPGGISLVSQELATATVLALCDARGAAAIDPRAAAEPFLDRAHDGLHLIAAALATTDAAASGAILEGTSLVEGDLMTDPPGPALLPDLEGVLGATRNGVETLGLAAPDCA